MQKLKLDQVEESKYFVDMKLKYPEQKTLEDFNKLTDKEKNDREFMSNWLNDYFDPPGSEFQNHQFDQDKFHFRWKAYCNRDRNSMTHPYLNYVYFSTFQNETRPSRTSKNA